LLNTLRRLKPQANTKRKPDEKKIGGTWLCYKLKGAALVKGPMQLPQAPLLRMTTREQSGLPITTFGNGKYETVVHYTKGLPQMLCCFTMSDFRSEERGARFRLPGLFV